MHQSDNSGFHRYFPLDHSKNWVLYPKLEKTLRKVKNITKKACKQVLLIQLALANFIVGIFLTLVAHSMWVTLVVAAVLTVMTALLAFYFWFDQPEWKEGFPTKSQLYRAKLNTWMTGIEIRRAERALLKAIVDLRSGERLW